MAHARPGGLVITSDVTAAQTAHWWRRVLLIAKVSRLIDVRIMSPEFRLTRNVCILLAAVVVVLAVLLGLSIALFVTAGPTLIQFLGPVDQILPVMLRGVSVLFMIHHLLSVSGRAARDAKAPADAAILAHAGCTQGQLITARVLLPIALETAIMVIVLILCGGLAIYSWGLPADTVVLPTALGLALTVSSALARGAVLCMLVMGGVSPTLLRSACWAVIAAGLGAIVTGVLLPTFLGMNDLRSTAQMAFMALISPESTTVLLVVTVVLLLTVAVATLWLQRRPWGAVPVDSFPTRRSKPLPLPSSAWGRLVALPLTVIRDQPDSDSGEFLISVRTASLVAVFGLGALLSSSLEPILPTEAAWGIVAGGPVVAAGLAHGICSVNALRSLLPQLTASDLGERGTASALACSALLLCAPLGAASLPLVLVVSALPVSSALTAWIIGALVTPGIMLLADCVFPALPPAESNGRIRQHPMASLLMAGLALAFGALAYAALHAGIPAPLIVMGCATATVISILIAHFPRGTN